MEETCCLILDQSLLSEIHQVLKPARALVFWENSDAQGKSWVHGDIAWLGPVRSCVVILTETDCPPIPLTSHKLRLCNKAFHSSTFKPDWSNNWASWQAYSSSKKRGKRSSWKLHCCTLNANCVFVCLETCPWVWRWPQIKWSLSALISAKMIIALPCPNISCCGLGQILWLFVILPAWLALQYFTPPWFHVLKCAQRGLTTKLAYLEPVAPYFDKATDAEWKDLKIAMLSDHCMMRFDHRKGTYLCTDFSTLSFGYATT